MLEGRYSENVLLIGAILRTDSVGCGPIEYRPELDGLRALAVVLVMLFHAFPNNLRGGYVGVDVFFVISGYLITKIILAQLQSQSFSYVKFYAGRLRRLMPALLLVLAVSLCTGWVFLLPVQFVSLSREAVSSSLFVANVFFFNNSGYFDAVASARPLLHLWSLGVEQQFYIFWPIIIVLTRLRGVLPLVVIGAVSFFVNLQFVHDQWAADFYLPITRVWEFTVGATLIHLERFTTIPLMRGRQWLVSLVVVMGLILIIAAAIVFNKRSPYPGWRAFVPVMGTALVIWATSMQSLARSVLGCRLAQWGGRISYPLYLWHWPILVFMSQMEIGNNTPAASAAGLGLSIILAATTYPFEKFSQAWLRKPRRTFIFLIGLTGVTAAMAVAVIVLDGVPSRFPALLNSTQLAKLHQAAERGRTSISSYRGGRCFLDRSQRAEDFPAECVSQAKNGIVLWGDSHAAHLYPGLKAKMGDVVLSQFTQTGCPPLLGWVNPASPTCNQNNRVILERVKGILPNAVLLSGSWGDYTYSDIELGLQGIIRGLRIAGVEHVVVIGPAPRWSKDLEEVLTEYYIRNGEIPKRLKKGFEQRIFDIDRDLAGFAAAHDAEYISLLDRLCTEDGCQTLTAEDELMNADFGHFSRSGSETVVEGIGNKLRALYEHR